MVFKDILSMEKELIEKEISGFIKREIEISPDDPHAREILNTIREYTMRGGKRVRSILVVMGYRSVGGRKISQARRASISLELIQSMLLIHDDIIDESPERRGAPSFHKLMESRHLSRELKGDPVKFGTDIAIIGGDLAESLGEKALVTSGFPSERILDALLLQADMIRDTGLGQVLDLYSEALHEWSEDMVLKVQKYKTARYTFEGPLQIGAALHGATETQMRSLSEFSIPVGVAFQIIDDILGFFGDPGRGGKEDIADIKEGKRTLLILKALENVSEMDREMIENALGKKDLTVEEAEIVRKIVKECGSEQYSREKAEELSKIGMDALEKSDLDPEVVGFLGQLTGYLLSRA
jgi:geranylgeranyl diphosphate synthase type I